ncbi:MAG TPA: hypothetical protein VN345_04860 [Blastocatellia bacterium]|nr:hypothetical protein [Blastocatellia bacterium]
MREARRCQQQQNCQHRRRPGERWDRLNDERQFALARFEGRLRPPQFRDVYVHHTPTNNRARFMIDQRNFHDFTPAYLKDARVAVDVLIVPEPICEFGY